MNLKLYIFSENFGCIHIILINAKMGLNKLSLKINHLDQNSFEDHTNEISRTFIRSNFDST